MINKTVAIIGVGGLGGYVTEFVARQNFKNIILIDKDKFSKSNLNRQLMCTKHNLNTSKVDSYEARIKEISDSNVIVINDYLTNKTTDCLDKADLVFDCLDNVESRLILEKACEERNIPLVHGGIEDKFGQVCLCLPKDKIVSKLYKDKKKKVLETNSYSVAAVASLQVALAMKYFDKKYKDVLNNLYMIDLNDLEITKVKIK